MTHSLSLNIHLVHHCLGRARFRIDRLSYDRDYAVTLEQFLLEQPEITQVRVNGAAASIAIQYRSLNLSHLIVLIETAATEKTISTQPTPPATASKENWSSLALPIFTTIASWLSHNNRLLWLRPIAWTSLITLTLPIVKRASLSLWRDQKLNIDCLDLVALGLSYGQGKLVTPALVLTLHELGDLIRDRTAR
ncbi:MAG: heavy metal translocating P-type ATPase, partial [Halothece sp. Uz-M2-17]|nr:heavy metal translocating P-type ATPase [Halothece sp. Uz-M2-17]